VEEAAALAAVARGPAGGGLHTPELLLALGSIAKRGTYDDKEERSHIHDAPRLFVFKKRTLTSTSTDNLPVSSKISFPQCLGPWNASKFYMLWSRFAPRVVPTTARKIGPSGLRLYAHCLKIVQSLLAWSNSGRPNARHLKCTRRASPPKRGSSAAAAGARPRQSFHPSEFRLPSPKQPSHPREKPSPFSFLSIPSRTTLSTRPAPRRWRKSDRLPLVPLQHVGE
jgi:hypothetical protein